MRELAFCKTVGMNLFFNNFRDTTLPQLVEVSCANWQKNKGIASGGTL